MNATLGFFLMLMASLAHGNVPIKCVKENSTAFTAIVAGGKLGGGKSCSGIIAFNNNITSYQIVSVLPSFELFCGTPYANNNRNTSL